jgi:hypothetical protein
MITTTTASCISLLYDICSCKSHHHEIQGTVVIVIIWLCDLQLHMSYITEIQEVVVVVSISVIYDIYSCKSHHHMITTTTASCISVIHDICSHMVVWFTTTYVIYYWNTRGHLCRDHMVVWFTTTYVMYYWNTCFSNTWHM